jgi:hypothetical protein
MGKACRLDRVHGCAKAGNASEAGLFPEPDGHRPETMAARRYSAADHRREAEIDVNAK